MHVTGAARHWSAHLQQCSGDPSLTFDENACLLLLAGRQRIECRLVQDALIFRARICDAPASQDHSTRQCWLQRVLELVGRYIRTRREIASLTDDGVLRLSVWVHADADYAEFCMVYDRFMDALDAWRNALLPPLSSRSERQDFPSTPSPYFSGRRTVAPSNAEPVLSPQSPQPDSL